MAVFINNSQVLGIVFPDFGSYMQFNKAYSDKDFENMYDESNDEEGRKKVFADMEGIMYHPTRENFDEDVEMFDWDASFPDTVNKICNTAV